MSYEKQTWNKYDDLKTEEENIENGAVVTDNRMNHMESGIGDNDTNLASHLANTNNPHKVTAVQIGLDKVINVKQASKVEFDSHTSDISNPHKVTAAQVGAYSKSETDTKFATNQSLTNLSTKVIANKGNLASGTDLDNVIDIGTYQIGGLTGGADIINVPSERSGTTIYAYLTVSGTTTSVVQELIVYDSKTVSQIYSRSRSGSTPTFSPWSKTVMADDSGKVTVSNTIDSGQVKTATINTGYGRSAVITRIGNTVTITSQNQHSSVPANGSWQRGVGTLPVGFRPVTDALVYNHDLTNASKFSWSLLHPNGVIDLFSNGNITTTDYILTSGQFWITKDDFPN
ncbi:pyocin knob domain-containing protein [Lactococcus lactis]|uniref:pyocin knob domain-containing protein n=1 Tax=Lactococcus lactis TaxID=1358 RepID=UPI003D2C3644